MKRKERSFISIYFSDGLLDDRKKRDVTLAFAQDDEQYEVCKKLGSSGIKEALGIDSYSKLVKEAKKEDRSLSNYIKYHLRVSQNK